MAYFTGRPRSDTIGPFTSHNRQGTTNGNVVFDGQEKYDKLKKEYVVLQSKFEDNLKVNKKLKSKIVDLEIALAGDEEKLEIKKQEIADLRYIAAVKDQKLRELIDDNDAKTKEVTSLEAENEKNELFWRKALAGEQDLHRSYKEELERSKAELHVLRENTVKLEEELNIVKKEEIALLKQVDQNMGIKLQLTSIESNLEASTREVSKQSEKLALAKRENEELQERVYTEITTFQQQQALKEKIRSLQTSSDGGIHRHWLINVNEINMTNEILGTGAFGKVYAAEFRGIKMAAKSLHDIILSPYNREKFNREMSLSATARHPNIVQFIGAADIDNPILLYELMTTSLQSHLLKGQPLTHPQVLDAGCDIAAALSYLHQHKPHPIIHRDVSSPNVLMDPLPRGKWRHKLSDLGAANLQCCVGKNSKLPGNPCYAAPEADNPDSHTPAMDVYSFGVLLMEITLCRALEGTREARNEQCNTIDWEPMKELVQMCTVGDYLKRPCISHVLRILQKF